MDGWRNASLTETVENVPESGRGGNLGRNFVSVFVAGQLFGTPVLTVQAVLGPQPMTRVPLAPPEVAGSLNLRGRIVTAIDPRWRQTADEIHRLDDRLVIVADVAKLIEMRYAEAA